MEIEGGNSGIKLINNGAYGCIFRPGITCNGTRERKNFVTKIQKHSKTIQNEISISDRIQKIKGYMKYYAPIMKSCPVKVSKRYQHEINKCEIFQKDSKSSDEERSVYISNKIRYVGSMTLEDYLIAYLEKRKSCTAFWTSYSYLLHAIKLLFEHDIIHYDLRYNNVMYDSRLDVPIIIDFGLSIYTKELGPNTYTKAFYVYDFYSYWCIDIMICNYIFQIVTYERSKKTEVTKDHIELILDNFIYGLNNDGEKGKARKIHNGLFAMKIIPDVMSGFKEMYFKYMSAFIGKTWFELYTELMKYSNTWDNYSLAVIYMFVLDEQFEKQNIFNTIIRNENESFSAYINILKQILFSPPNERMSPKNTLIELKRNGLI
jgi:serine/threonine protein kinase